MPIKAVLHVGGSQSKHRSWLPVGCSKGGSSDFKKAKEAFSKAEGQKPRGLEPWTRVFPSSSTRPRLLPLQPQRLDTKNETDFLLVPISRMLTDTAHQPRTGRLVLLCGSKLASAILHIGIGIAFLVIADWIYQVLGSRLGNSMWGMLVIDEDSFYSSWHVL
jgi:hypothetical protein